MTNQERIELALIVLESIEAQKNYRGGVNLSTIHADIYDIRMALEGDEDYIKRNMGVFNHHKENAKK